MTDPSSQSGITPLNKVLAAILRDVDKAQNASNIYSSKLSRYYKNNKTLSYFPVPNGCIQEVELDLKLAIDGIALPGPSDEEQIEQAINIFKTVSIYLSNDIGSVLRAKLVPTGTEEQQAQIRQASEAVDGKVFKEKLSAKVFGNLTEALEGLVSAEKGLNYEATLSNVKATLKTAVLQHETMKTCLCTTDALEGLQDDLAELVEDVLKRAVGAAVAFELWDTPNLNVIVNTNDLTEVPEYLLTTLNVKVHQRNYKWVLNAQIPNSTDPGIAAEMLEPVENG